VKKPHQKKKRERSSAQSKGNLAATTHPSGVLFFPTVEQGKRIPRVASKGPKGLRGKNGSSQPKKGRIYRVNIAPPIKCQSGQKYRSKGTPNKKKGFRGEVENIRIKGPDALDQENPGEAPRHRIKTREGEK